MVLSETIGYITVFAVTIVFTAFSFAVQDGIWRSLLKFIAGLFWMVLGISMFEFMGSDGFLMILSLPFIGIGLLFFFFMIHDFLSEKKRKLFEFDD